MGLKRTDEFRADAVRIALTSGCAMCSLSVNLVCGPIAATLPVTGSETA